MREPRNRIYPRRADPHPPTLRKVPADSVPFGDSISCNGRTVWVSYDGDTLLAVAATADEARRKFRDEWMRRERERAHGGAEGGGQKS